MNMDVRNTFLTPGAREVMRPLALRIAQQMLAGSLHGTAMVLFYQALDVVYYERDEETPVADGWEDYYHDCMDLVESYKSFQGYIQTDPNCAQGWKLLGSLRGSNSLDTIRALVTLETLHSALASRLRQGK